MGSVTNKKRCYLCNNRTYTNKPRSEVDQKIVDQYFKKGQRNWYDNQSKNKIEKSTSYWFDTKNLGKKPMGKTKSNV